MGLNPKGRDWGSLVNWDDLGKAYAGFTLAWTIILYAGVGWLVLNHRVPFVRMRNLPLTVTSVSFLHVYLVKICLAYMTNGNFPCSAEYWIMSIYLPFGIALFQANLAQLRSISDQQQKLISAQHLHPFQYRGRGLWARWKALPLLEKTYGAIALGMIIQLIITTVLFALTPTLQGDWSSYGDLPFAKGQAKCRKSYEWIPSAFWQLTWAWFYGPYTLYSIRNIRDVHFWRLQVILSVVSGLPGSPLWLMALFSTWFKSINRWFVPPMWLAPGIVVMQFVTVFFPIYEGFLSHYQLRSNKSIKSNLTRYKSVSSFGRPSSPATSYNLSEKTAVESIAPTSRKYREMYSMSALEKTLAINPIPLLHFAATRDFTAENILFLNRVRHWRSAWALAARAGKGISEETRFRLYLIALEIYISSVSDKTTEFPINIESQIRNELDSIFSAAVPDSRNLSSNGFNLFNSSLTMSGPLDSPSWTEEGTGSATYTETPPSPTLTAYDTKKSELSYSVSSVLPKPPSGDLDDLVTLFSPTSDEALAAKARGVIPFSFDKHVFDAAENSIKYLVLTNTWSKFVRLGHGSPTEFA